MRPSRAPTPARMARDAESWLSSAALLEGIGVVASHARWILSCSGGAVVWHPLSAWAAARSARELRRIGSTILIRNGSKMTSDCSSGHPVQPAGASAGRRVSSLLLMALARTKARTAREGRTSVGARARPDENTRISTT